MQGDLTTLAKVKEWLSGQSTLASGNDSLLQRLISSASAFVHIYLQRDIVVKSYDEWYDSGGLDFVSLRQYPVRSVTSVQFGGIEVTQQASGNPAVNGWLLSPPSRLMVRGHCFPRGRNVVRVQYQAGYSTESEPYVVPAMAPLTIVTSRTWLGDLNVALLDGTVLTPVSGAPGAGQYSVAQDPTSGEGTYTLNAAQAGATVLISYSSVPPDLEQAVIELVGERFRQKDRIGLTSKNLANGETVGFLNKDMSDNIKMTLQPYKATGSW